LKYLDDLEENARSVGYNVFMKQKQLKKVELTEEEENKFEAVILD
jgi:hypothetical protein